MMKYIPLALLLALPHAAEAQSVQSLINDANTGLITPLIGVLGAIALLVFFWGLVKFIYNAGSDQGRSEGKQRMMWGIIALFVLVSIVGIIQLFQRSIFGEGTVDTAFQVGG